ncbi:MAG TPA: hypothetical protein VF149_08095 [Bacillales bacterium]
MRTDQELDRKLQMLKLAYNKMPRLLSARSIIRYIKKKTARTMR